MLPRLRFVLCKALACLGLLIAAALMTSPTHAGTWSVTYRCSGTLTDYLYPDSEYNPSDSYSWLPNAAPYYHLGNDFSAGEEYDVYGTYSDGTVQATLTWNAAGANDPPPSQVYVVESAFAAASGGEINNVDDGLGDAGSNNIYGGSKSQMLPTNGQTTVSLPSRHLKASTTFPEEDLRDLVTEVVTSYSVSTPGPPKSVMIGGLGGTQEYVGGAWQGKGDTLFSNDVYGSGGMGGVNHAGNSYPPLDWSASLLGTPWPSQFDIYTGICDRDWQWQGPGGSGDDDTTFDIRSLRTDRPHVDWPFSSDGFVIRNNARDGLEELENAPSSQTQVLIFDDTDADNSGLQPAINFTGGASYHVTFHNEKELLQTQPTEEVPTSQNPWVKMMFQGADIETDGLFSNWSPSIYFSVDVNWNITVNAVYIGGGVGGSTGQGLYINPPQTTVPAGSHGCVYAHPSIIRHPFTYNHYLVGGRDIRGYDSNGNEIPFSGSVNRSRGGLGTNDIDTKIYVFQSSQEFPPTIAYD